MCGIAGVVDYAGMSATELRAAVARMCATMVQRGPDDFGMQILSSAEAWHYAPVYPEGIRTPRAGDADVAVALGSRRLAIIDLSDGGHQPMSNADGTVWVTHNGEIYNFLTLRTALEERRYQFKGSSDTEVLIHGYDAWGAGGLISRLRGMFAFALWDDRRGALVLARDRYGIKPLYYSVDGERLLFGSEVRALAASGLVPLREDLRARIAYLLTGSIPAPWTTLANVRVLPAGHFLTFDHDGTRLVAYHVGSPSPVTHDRAFNAEATTPAVRRALEEAIELHLISDAPLGVFLSGGIDSSAITALAATQCADRLTTVSVVFDEPEYSEARYQRALAARYRTDHRELVVRAGDFWEELPNIFSAMDQPSIDGVNTYFVSRAAKQAGLTVVLSGLGGDEIFRGYPTFGRVARLRRLQRLPARLRLPLRWSERLPGPWRRLGYLTQDDPLSLYLTLRGLFTPAETARLIDCEQRQVLAVVRELAPAWRDERPEVFIQRMEFEWYMRNQLLKDSDVMSMAHSVEVRVPLLDHHLVETVARARVRPNGGTPKPLLVAALGDLLPREIVNRNKQGFTFPFAKWLRAGPGRELLGQGPWEEHLWREFLAGRAHWSRVWAAAVANHWWGMPRRSDQRSAFSHQL